MIHDDRPDVSVLQHIKSEVFVSDQEIPKRVLTLRMNGYLQNGKWDLELSIRDNEINMDYVIPVTGFLEEVLRRIEIVEEIRFNH